MRNKQDKICHYSGLPSVATYKSDYVYDNMLDIMVSCAHCGIEFEIKVDNIDGKVSREDYCSACLKKIVSTLTIQDGDIIKLQVSQIDEE